MEKIGVIAGGGKLPAIWTGKAAARGFKVYYFPVVEEDTLSIPSEVEEAHHINLGKLNELMVLLKQYDIEKLILLGKINKEHLFNNLQMDKKMKQLLAGLDNLNDESILAAIARELKQAGIEILPQSTFIEHLIPEPGVLTTARPDDELQADMRYGFKMAQAVGRLEIGQTVIVKNCAVMAVEAIEGTDAAIARGGSLGQQGITMAKVSRPDQDIRFDLPTIGLQTLSNLIKVEARGLIFEADKTFLIEKEKFIEQADEAGICVAAGAVNTEGELSWLK